MTLDVYTVGGLPWISQALKGIVLIIGDSAYHTALKVTLLWAMVIGGIMAARKASIFPLSHLLISFFLFHGFYSAKVDVNVTDAKLGENYVVTDVPFGVGVVTSMFSMLGHTLSNLIDTAFHTGTVVVYGVNNSYIADIDYEKTGYLGTMNYFTRAKLLEIKDPETYRRTIAYLKQCFIPYVSTLDETELNSLLKEKDLFGSGKLEVPINLIMKYDGESWYCKDFYENMVAPKINDFLGNVVSTPSLIGFASSTDLNRYKSVINALTNASYSVASAVSQPAVINAIKTALLSYSSTSDDLNREIISAYVVGEAEGKFKLLAKSIGNLAKDLIPSLAIAMEFLIIVASSTIAILFLLPQAQEAFWRYVRLSAWIYFWFPALATLDALAKVGAIYKLHSVLLATNTNGLTLASIGQLLSEADNISAIAGYLALSVPGIAWLLLQGSEYVVASLASTVVGRATQNISAEEMVKSSVAEKVGYETTGQIGEGFAVRSSLFANPTSMASSFGSAVAGASSSILQGSYLGGITETAMNAGGGTATYKAHGGSIEGLMETGALTKGVKAFSTSAGIVTQRPNLNGSIASQNFEKAFSGNLFTSTLSNSYKQLLSEGLKESYQELRSLTTENAQNVQAGYREFSKFTDAVINSFQDGARYSKVLESSEIESLKKMKQLRDSLSDALDISKEEATQVVKTLSAKLSFDSKFREEFSKALGKGKLKDFSKLLKKALGGIGAGIEDRINADKIDMAKLLETAKELSEFTQSHGYEYALSAIDKISKDDSIAHSIIGSYQKDEGKSIDLSKVRSYSEKLASSVHKALGYEKQKQRLQEEGDSFSIDLSQKFINWYANKRGISPEEAHIELNKLATYQPLQLEILTDEFTKNYIKETNFETNIPEEVDNRLHSMNLTKTSPQDFYLSQKGDIEQIAKAKGTGSSVHQRLEDDYSKEKLLFDKNYENVKEGINRDTPIQQLNSFNSMKEKVWELSPTEAKKLLNSNRLGLLLDNTDTWEKIAWGATSASSLVLSKEALEVGKGAANFAKNFIKSPFGLVTTAIAAEGALIAYENKRYVETELQKMAEAETKGEVRQINSLDELNKGEVGTIQKGGYTFEIIKEPHRFNLTPGEAIAVSHGEDLSTYTVIAKGPEGKPQVFVLDRNDAEKLINEGITPGWMKVANFSIGDSKLPGYKVDN